MEDPVRATAESVEALGDGGRMAMLDHVRPSGGAGRLADLATRISGPLVGEHWNRDTRVYVEPAPLRTLREESLSGGWMRLLVLEREARKRSSATEARVARQLPGDERREARADMRARADGRAAEE